MYRQRPTVSVIIPTYNPAHLVGRAIHSVLQQTYQELNIRGKEVYNYPTVGDQGRLIDTNIFLEVLLEQDRAREARQLLSKTDRRASSFEEV